MCVPHCEKMKSCTPVLSVCYKLFDTWQTGRCITEFQAISFFSPWNLNDATCVISCVGLGRTPCSCGSLHHCCFRACYKYTNYLLTEMLVLRNSHLHWICTLSGRQWGQTFRRRLWSPPQTTKKRFHMDSQVRYMGAHPLYRPLSRRGLLDTIKLAYDPRCWNAGS